MWWTVFRKGNDLRLCQGTSGWPDSYTVHWDGKWGVFPIRLSGKTMLAHSFSVHTADVTGQVQAGSTLASGSGMWQRHIVYCPTDSSGSFMLLVQFQSSAQGVKTSRHTGCET